MYKASNPASTDRNYGIVVVRSNTWPGAVTFFTEGRWTQLYVGDGLKFEKKTYYPISPPVVQSDPSEKPTYKEVSTLFKSILSFSQTNQRKLSKPSPLEMSEKLEIIAI